MAIQIWSSKEKTDDKIIAFLGDSIYKANPLQNDIESYSFELKMKNKPSKNSFEIPIRYISQITLQDHKSHIEILFRGDTEHFKVSDTKTREEIFEYFKLNIPGAKYSLIKKTPFQSARKPLIAIAVICGIYSWCLYIANGIEAGNQYGVTGDHYNSLAGIVLAIASLGIKKTTLIFGSLFLIAAISFYRKFKNPPVKKTIFVNQ